MRTVLTGVFAVLISLPCIAQDSLALQSLDFPENFLGKLHKRIERIDQQLLDKSDKLLLDLEKQERKLFRKLKRKDSTAANKLFHNSLKEYDKLRKQLKNGESLAASRRYLPYLDSIRTSLQFLSVDPASLKISNTQLASAQEIISSLDKQFQNSFGLSELIKARRQILKNELEKFGLVKELKSYSKKLYYYAEQAKAYKEMWDRPERLERTALSLLQKLPAFQKFWREHSQLATLFPMPDNYGTMAALQGLQTRAVVQASIQQQIQAGGPNAPMVIQQNIQAAHQQIRQWKEKLNKASGLNSDAEIPDFKPNSQRTKKFLSRLEYNFNIQNTRANAFWPVSTDFGVSIGFKINDFASCGLGGSYRMGWGRDIRNIRITHEGIGLRSYFEYKIRGNIYASGGYEQNYRQHFDNMRMLPDPNHWQKSALVGVSKRYSINKKLKGDFKAFFDILYKSHSPASQPILLRFGYGL